MPKLHGLPLFFMFIIILNAIAYAEGADNAYLNNVIAEYIIEFENLVFNISIVNKEVGNNTLVLIEIKTARVLILNKTNYWTYVFLINGSIINGSSVENFTQMYTVNLIVANTGNIPIHHDVEGDVIAGVPVYYVGPIVGADRFKPIFGFIKPEAAFFCVSRFNVSDYISGVRVEALVNGTYTWEDSAGTRVVVSVPVEGNETYYAVTPCAPMAALPILFPPDSLSPVPSIPDDSGIVRGDGFALVWSDGDAFVCVRNLTVRGFKDSVEIVRTHDSILLELMKGVVWTWFELSYNAEGFLVEGVIEVPVGLSHILASLMLFPFFTTPPEVSIDGTMYDLRAHSNVNMNETSKAVVRGTIYYGEHYIVEVEGRGGIEGWLLAIAAASIALAYVLKRASRR